MASLLSSSNTFLTKALVPAAALGVLSHLLHFIRGEHHARVVRIFQFYTILPTLAVLGLVRLRQLPIKQAVQTVGAVGGAYFGAMFTSILIYRVFFHRLRKFPGPFMAGLTKMWHVGTLSGTNNFQLYEKLTTKYGPYVRIGPNDLVVTDADAIPLIHGMKSKCTKSPAYDATLPLMSLHQSRDKAEHDRRRRVWDRGFSIKALKGYESRVANYTKLLNEQIRSFSGGPVDVSKWFNYYSFDVMGDLAFGKSFDMLKKGETHFAIGLLHEGQRGLGIIGPMPWLLLLMTRTPIVSKGYWTFVNWCEAQVEKRKKMTVEEPDIMSWLLEADPMSSDPAVERNWLSGDARLIIVAGSDTTAATLVHIFYHLARDPKHADKIREEISALGDVELNDANLRDLKYMNAVIEETLRMHPPVPGGVVRDSPPEGLQIGDRFIPGGVHLVTPNWSIQRSPKYFIEPNEFVPERWTSKPEMILQQAAFVPFLTGRYSCIGKQLAYMELRAVTATLLQTYDVKFAPGETGADLLNKTADCFTLVLAPLKLQFTPRF